MNPIASYLHCAQCSETMLHTSRGCCRHQRPALGLKQERTPRKPRATRGRYAITLTKRERAAIVLASEGKSYREIGLALGILKSSVSAIMRRAMNRVGAKTPADLPQCMNGGA